jgi:hypothetical protein
MLTVMATHVTSALCCDPFTHLMTQHNVRKNLNNLLPWMTGKLLQLSRTHKVCDKCCKMILKLKCVASSKQNDGDEAE